MAPHVSNRGWMGGRGPVSLVAVSGSHLVVNLDQTREKKFLTFCGGGQNIKSVYKISTIHTIQTKHTKLKIFSKLGLLENT